MATIKQLIIEAINRRQFLGGIGAMASGALKGSISVESEIDKALSSMHNLWKEHAPTGTYYDTPEMNGIFHPAMKKIWHKHLNNPNEPYRGFRQADFWQEYQSDKSEGLRSLNDQFKKDLAKAIPGFMKKHGIQSSGGLAHPDIMVHADRNLSKKLLDNMPHEEFDQWMDYHDNNPHTWGGASSNKFPGIDVQ